jgi:predicted anti-sigma-YlaC factor YlaD
MTCRELTEFLDDHFEGKLPKSVADEFEGHLSVCPECRTYLENYRLTTDLVRDSANRDAETLEGVPDELVAAVLEARRRLS